MYGEHFQDSDFFVSESSPNKLRHIWSQNGQNVKRRRKKFGADGGVLHSCTDSFVLFYTMGFKDFAKILLRLFRERFR